MMVQVHPEVALEVIKVIDRARNHEADRRHKYVSSLLSSMSYSKSVVHVTRDLQRTVPSHVLCSPSPELTIVLGLFRMGDC